MAEPLSVLLVDDDAGHRMLISRSLKRAGLALSLLEAASVGEALKLVSEERAGRIALILLDLNLSDARGTKLLAELRPLPQFSSLPVLILSTSALERDINEAMEAGATEYLVKSGDPAQLGADILEVIKRLAPEVCS